MMNTLELAAHGPVIPVIVLDRVADAVPLARALVAGGVRVLEVTLRTPAALACIEAIARAVPEAIVQAVGQAGGAFRISLPGRRLVVVHAGGQRLRRLE